jgi:hypothetical protein
MPPLLHTDKSYQPFEKKGGGGGVNPGIIFTLAFDDIQGGSDESGIFKVIFKNHTAELKIIRFY